MNTTCCVIKKLKFTANSSFCLVISKKEKKNRGLIQKDKKKKKEIKNP